MGYFKLFGKSAVFFFALLMGFGLLPARDLKLHGIFSDHMVLQRDQPIKIWGWCAPRSSVEVTFGERSGSTHASSEDGRWEVFFDPMAADSRPRSLRVEADGQRVDIANIVIGDVWVMNGQSNMAWDLKKTFEGDLESTQADLPLLRLLTINSIEKQQLQEDLPEDRLAGGWAVSNPETAGNISAIGFAFGSRVQRATGIPIGIIDNARGGASLEALVPKRKFLEHPLTKRYLEYIVEQEINFDEDVWLEGAIQKWERKVERARKQDKPESQWPKKPTKDDIRSWDIPGMSPSDAGACYNGMFGAFIGYNIKGVLFHQGYNNALGSNCRPKRYRILMRLMIEGWREDFNNPNMPVGVIGFCATNTPQTAFDFEAFTYLNGPFIRESQRLGLADVGDPENTAFLPAHDIQIPGLHPRKKADHGIRAARWALSEIYDLPVNWDTAALVSSEARGDTLVLTFNQEVYPHDEATLPEGFAIAGSDGIFYRAYARFEHNKDLDVYARLKDFDTRRIHLWSPLIEEPVAVRYAWSHSPHANLYVNGRPWAPLTSFRTDEWDMPESEDPAVDGLPGRNWREEKAKAKANNEFRLREEAKMMPEILERLETLGQVN